MHVGIVTPAESGSLAGNRVTSERWAHILRGLGHQVSLETDWDGQPWDALVALHARRSADAVRAFDARRPEAPLVVALGGTDLYVDLPAGDADTLDSLRRADHILALQARADRMLPPEVRAKVVVVPQSAEPLAEPPAPRDDVFEVAVVAHLRAVKAPLLAAEAARLLPADSRIEVVHVGGVIDAGLEARAHEAMAASPRYRWLGPRDHAEARELIARARLLAQTSRAEGGANVVSEALVLGTPVVATRIDGTVGMLGEDYPGYVPVDDAQALAALLHRAETDPDFLAALASACSARAGAYTPEAERDHWAQLVAAWESSPATG